MIGTETETDSATTTTSGSQTNAIVTETTLSNATTKAIIPIEQWRRERSTQAVFDTWFQNNTNELRENADKDGPILDFVIAGFPKCGTTAMMTLLSSITPMPGSVDVCTPLKSTVWYAYNLWPKEHTYDNSTEGHHFQFIDTKPLRGSKCPYYVESKNDRRDFARSLSKTKLIVGIRHPVKWFQSFLNMQWYHFGRKSPKPLIDYVDGNHHLLKASTDNHECNKGAKVCSARSRFYLSLAKLGKTALDEDEIALLSSELFQARARLNNDASGTVSSFSQLDNPPTFLKNASLQSVGVPNDVFLFESSQGRDEYFYEDIAGFLGIERSLLPPLNNDTYKSGNGLNSKKATERQDNVEIFNICLPEFDYVRKELMPIAYTLQQWLLKYLIPAARKRDDLVIPGIDTFETIVAETFGSDPCTERPLVRNETDGEYY